MSPLEKLARVPKGTAAKHDAWIARKPPHAPSFETHAQYEAEIIAVSQWRGSASPEILRYRHFLADNKSIAAEITG
jgi:hypothetical protein